MLKQTLDDSDGLDSVFHALADPTRRAMVERLRQGSASVSELAVPFAMSLSAVLQHLQILEASGLVRTEKAGRVRMCRIDIERLDQAFVWFEQARDVVQSESHWRPEIPSVEHVRQGVFCLD